MAVRLVSPVDLELVWKQESVVAELAQYAIVLNAAQGLLVVHADAKLFFLPRSLVHNCRRLLDEGSLVTIGLLGQLHGRCMHVQAAPAAISLDHMMRIALVVLLQFVPQEGVSFTFHSLHVNRGLLLRALGT